MWIKRPTSHSSLTGVSIFKSSASLWEEFVSLRLAAYFRGQKKLFKGLYLEKAEEELARQEKREPWQVSLVCVKCELHKRHYKASDILAFTLQ